jgi:HD-GYP domain-containing protein (c-di-GMP phosphodiesterase class II)/DNA-binding CsgD family transcriptional regulator
VRIGELLGALSLATDLATGCPLETTVRTCVLATQIARRLGITDVAEVRRVALLRHLGCTGYAYEAARTTAGDDQDVLRAFAGVDHGVTAVAGRALTRLAREATFGKRLVAIVGVLSHPGAREELVSAQCAQAIALARDLRMPPGVVRALGQIYERHDGRGLPDGVAGEELALSARVVHVAELVEIHHRTGGRDSALAELQRRRGKHVAAEVADVVLADPDRYWDVLESPSAWDLYVDEEDSDVPGVEVLDLAIAFGRFADLKSPSMLGHSTDVAALAAAAADEGDVTRVRIAGLLHDLGMVSVPNGIWEKRGALNDAEWERVRLHAYYTERILTRTPALAGIASLAGAHHERLDGSGYHRGAHAPGLDRAARLIAVADAYYAMRSPRPHRPAIETTELIDRLATDAREGRLCRRAVDAILAVAGHRVPRAEWPAGLSAREVEVLVHLARGLTNKEIASSLNIAVRTANHHVENIYAKTHITTRAAAALFAVRHDLVTVDPEPGRAD